jgi:hypothetical protein
MDVLQSPPRLLLFNFDIGRGQLKPEHERALRALVTPKLGAGGAVSIVGLASRSGSFSLNDRLSLQRATSVLDFLRREVPSGFPVRAFKAFGEHKAQFDHVRDGTEDERYRSVVLFISDGPAPPEPSVNDASLQEIPVPVGGDGVLDTIGKILDIVSSTASLLNLVLDVVIVDLAGTLLAAIAAVIGLPAAWLSGNALAERNGKKLGIAKSLQAMSDSFSDDDLRLRPEAKWPPVPHPVPTFSPPDEAVTLAERSARAGHRQGYELAWSLIMGMEKSPRLVPVTVKGKAMKLSLSGRRFLWLIHRAYGDDAWRQILRALDRQ